MNNELKIENDITINATAAKVWDILTNPQQTKKYMFGCETVSDWKVGSELLWRGVFDGVEMVAVKGNIVALEPEKLLAYTTIDPNSATPDMPENYTTVTYLIEENDNNSVLLKITQGDYNKVADGKKRYDESLEGGGWSSILEQIKQIAEEK